VQPDMLGHTVLLPVIEISIKAENFLEQEEYL
jgi:hypothetical protein